MNHKLILKLNRLLIVLAATGIWTFIVSENDFYLLFILIVLTAFFINPICKILKIDDIVAKNFFE